MNVNQELFDLHIEHLLRTRRYDESVRLQLERISGRYRRTLGELLRDKLSPRREVDEAVKLYVQELYDTSEGAVSDYIGAELDFQSNSLKRVAKDFYKVGLVNRADFNRKLTSTPLKFKDSSKLSMKDSFSRLARDETVRVNSLIRRGLAGGKGPEELVREVLNSSRITEAQAKTLVATNLSHAEQLAKEAFAEANPELISGFVFTAILDSRTSKTCSSYDGLFQSTKNVKVRPPLHYNCRSKLVPVLASKDALLKSNSDRIKKKGLEEATGLTGDLPQRESFEDWLRRQSFAKQKEHLGSEEAVGLFQKRAVPLSDFFVGAGRPISIAALRVKDNLATWIAPVLQRATRSATRETLSDVTRPFQLVRSQQLQKDLADALVEDSLNANQSLSLMEYRGTTLVGKRSSRNRSANEFDERNTSFDPFTGETKSTLLYDPDFTLYRERLDYMKNSKLLDQNQKTFIETFADSLEDRLSVNQQTAVVENLRILFERYEKSRIPWEDFLRASRAEMNYSVVNVSQLLDTRSRARSELFLKFRGDPKNPALMISGEMVPIDTLLAEKLDYERYVASWSQLEGNNLARKNYYSLNSPWRAYFFQRAKPADSITDKVWESVWKRSVRKVFYKDDPIGFYTRYGKTPPKVTAILEKELKKKLTPKWWKKFKDINEEGVWDFVSRTVREQYRAIIDLEFAKRWTLKDLAEKAVSKAAKPIEADAIRVMGRLFEVVGEGTITDYDSLAIALGRELKKAWPDYTRFFGSSLQDFHEEGSKLLEWMRSAGMIRVNSRGVTRRATTDLDTGRTSGNFKDTVSREVQILDPVMLKLQDRNRRIELANRMGVDREANRYWARPNSKYYFDARGNRTSTPLITRSAFANFDEKQFDGDFADMLNHTMGSKYKVDPTFASFMDDLARFRDPRGRTEYYDSLNSFREEIVRRGDQGYGLMETVRYYLATGKSFSNHARIDGRGRVYFNGYLTPTGGEVVRPFLNSAHATAMTPGGLFQLRTQIGAVLGPSAEALTNSGRLAIFQRNEKSLLEIGGLLQATTQRDRRIREFLEHPLIQATDGAEVAKVARFALEYKRIWDHTKGDPDNLALLKTYKTNLAGESDASASGLQMIALATGDRGAAITSNVLQSRQKNRIYDLVAMDTVSDPRFQALIDELGVPITFDDLNKAAKYQVMISFYGAGQQGQAARVALELQKVLERRDVIVTTRKDFLAIQKHVDQKIKEAKSLGADETIADLNAFKKELAELVNNGDVQAGSTLIAEAAEIHPAVAEFVDKFSSTRASRVGPEAFKRIASIMSEKLHERAPVTGTFIDFYKRLAQDYARSTKKVRIPWVTFDGKVLYQDYRPKIQQEIRFYDPEARRYVRNIYQMDAEDGKLLGKNVGDVRLGFGVNGMRVPL